MTAANLEKNVRAVLSAIVLMKERMRKFNRKARDYKLTYLFLFEKLTECETMVSSTTHDNIEGIIKLFKQHRSALDADYAFIKNA